jgi:hypothetical protein
MCLHPERRRASAQALSVEPVVCTSSTSATRSGAVPRARISRRPVMRRTSRDAPSCRDDPPPRTSATASGRPVLRASARATSCAGSKPRVRRRPGCAGTATIAPSRIPGGAPAAMCAAMTSANGRAAPNFRACSASRATPSYATAAHASQNGASRAGQRRHGRGSAHRRQQSVGSHGSARRHAPHSRPGARGIGARQAAQRGGAARETSSANIVRRS